MMHNVHFPQCTIPIRKPFKCVPCIHEGSTHTWLVTPERLHPLLNSDNHSGLRLGPELGLYEAKAADEVSKAPRRSFYTTNFRYPIWDTWSASVYVLCGYTIVRISGDEVSVVAGSVTAREERDGSCTEARFLQFAALASDGAGALYIIQLTGVAPHGEMHAAKLRKVQLPAALRCSFGTGAAVPAAGLVGEAVVSTLPFEIASEGPWGLVHIPDPAGGPGSLVYGTFTALYRIQLGSEGETVKPMLLAGQVVEQQDPVDGRGEEACFVGIQGMTVDAEGRIICVEARPKDDAVDIDAETAYTSAVRCVAPDGTVTTLVANVDGFCSHPSILPNGYLVMHKGLYNMQVFVLSLGLKPRPLTQPSAATSSEPQPGRVSADWGALLDQPEATSDLTLVAGGRVFPVHRLVLSVRCEYFRQCLADGTFSEGSAAQLALPGAEPDALACVLRFIYSGTIDIPVALVCPVAELADRLLLPVLTAAACKQVRAGVATDTVADMLLWAERCVVRGGSFPQLLADLKTWYVEHYDDVKREARDSLLRLAAASPDLIVELLDMVTSALSEDHVSKRARLS